MSHRFFSRLASLRSLRQALPAAVGAAALALLANPAAAATFTWAKFGSGAFNNAANWFPGAVPGANDFVTFEVGWGQPYTVTFPGQPLSNTIGQVATKTAGGVANYSTGYLRVRDNGVTFDGSSSGFVGQSTYSVTNATQTEANRGIIIGEFEGDNSSLTMNHTGIVCCGGLSRLSGVAATLGDRTSARGTLNVGYGEFAVTGSDFTQRQLIIGNHGAGTLNVTGSGRVSVPGFNSTTSLGLKAGSSGTVDVNGPGASWTSANQLWIGENGSGSLTVRNGGKLVTDGSGGTASAILGVFNNSVGTATITGIGSEWTSNSELRIGNSGDGQLSVGSGGWLNHTNGFRPIMIGLGSQGSGSAIVSGAGSRLTSPGTVYVGSTGVGTLGIFSGGNVTVGSMLVRGLNSGLGQVLVGGAGSTLKVTTGDLTIGMPEGGFTTGATSLVIGPGSTVDVTHDVDLDANSTLRLQGGTLIANSIRSNDLLSLHYEGALEWTSGTMHVGTVFGNLTNQGGTLAPGVGIGHTRIDGNYTQQAGSTLAIELAGLNPSTEQDSVTIEGAAALGGQLALSLASGFAPAASQTFNILYSLAGISGNFANVANGQRIATTDGRGTFQVNYGAGSLFATNEIVLSNFQPTVIAGDLNHDGLVDASDLTEWQNQFGVSAGGQTTGGGSFLDWQRNNRSTRAAATLTVAAVPEPASLALAAVVAIAVAGACRQRGE